MIQRLWPLLVLAGAAQADISLTPPIACDLSSDCYIQQYVDHDPGPDAQDFTCGPLTYDGHKGTDFALKSRAQLDAGVQVLASAPGTVKAVRDGEADRLYSGDSNEVPSNKACGNGVLITHDDGWTTQYCHLKKGSVLVQAGQPVARGAPLGEVGLSGRTQFPHVHITVRKGDAVVDPFVPQGRTTCDAPPEDTLWDSAVPVRPGGMLEAGFSDRVPAFDAIKSGTAKQNDLPADAPALVVYGYAFGARSGDVMQLSIEGPRGTVIAQDVELDRTQALLFRAVGTRLTDVRWPEGTYTGRATLVRDGAVINTENTSVSIK
jgi:hypothetical protein